MSLSERKRNLETAPCYFQAIEVIGGVKEEAAHLGWEGEKMGEVGPIASYWESLRQKLSNLISVLDDKSGLEQDKTGQEKNRRLLVEIILADTWQKAFPYRIDGSFFGRQPLGANKDSEFGEKMILVIERRGKNSRSPWELVLASPEKVEEETIFLSRKESISFKDWFFSLKEVPYFPWLDVVSSLRKKRESLVGKGRDGRGAVSCLIFLISF